MANILFTEDIAFNDKFSVYKSQIEEFNNKFTDALITFIIPTINRESLIRSLFSLENQIIQNWKAIVIFDGCEPNNQELIQILNNKRILHICINKKGLVQDLTHGAAGFVRNIGMSLVTTPWIGFLDDDDTISPNYTKYLLDEIKITPRAELVCFRMIDNTTIIPPEYLNTIEFGYIGISFCYKTQLFKDGFVFSQSEREDFELINSIKNAKKKIIISPYISYFIRNSSIQNKVLRRIIIN